MLKVDKFINACNRNGVTFYTGVPDSLLSGLNHYMCDNMKPASHVVAVNEGAAIGIAIGHHLATGGLPLVYMQNSGLGNAINPLLSLASISVYSVPMILVIGWRGEPGRPDEPQHITQGEATLPLLEAMKIPTYLLPEEEAEAQSCIELATENSLTKKCPVAIIVKKGTFEPDLTPIHEPHQRIVPEITREQSIGCILDIIGSDFVVISTTGMASRELYELRSQSSPKCYKDFLTVGGMGHATSIAYGLGLSRPDQKILCLDGDGAALMHMGSLAAIGRSGLKNCVHIVLNNGCHDSVGGHPTGAAGINFSSVAKACGYASSSQVKTLKELEKKLSCLTTGFGPHFLEVLVAPGHRDNLQRPKSKPVENKMMLMEQLVEKKSPSL